MPRPPIAPAPRPASAGGADILAAVDLTLPPRRLAGAYRTAIAALAAALLLIPLAYLALLGFLLWLLVWHVYQAIASAELGPYLWFHVPMALLGGLLLLFLIKPVFLRRKTTSEHCVTLLPAEEPLLFGVVEKICAAVGAKAPAAIEVDCQPNAHARLRRGLRSLAGGDLVLRIGLPLAAALSVRQFVGVLAHEFGHFNQRTGMSGSYLIRRLNRFFVEVVFQRDRIDHSLSRLRRSRHVGGRIVFYLAAGPIEAGRGVLWLMLLAAELHTRSVLRQMEHDADLLEAHCCGAADFERTSQTLTFLAIAWARAQHDIADAWQRMRLADNLPRLVVANAAQMAEHRAQILQTLEQQTTGWFDTHPCHSDRVRWVQRAHPVGLVNCPQSSKKLFASFDALCAAATTQFYQGALGPTLGNAKLAPTAEIAAERIGQRQAVRALRRFLQGQVTHSRPLFPPIQAATAAEDLQSAAAALGAAREEMIASAALLDDAPDQLDFATAKLAFAGARRSFCDIYPRSPSIYSMRLKAVSEINQQEAVRTEAVRRLARFERAAVDRLTVSLQLLQRQEIRDQFSATQKTGDPNADPQLVGLMLGVCAAVQRSYPLSLRLRELAATLRVALSAVNPRRSQPKLVQHIRATSSRIVSVLNRLQSDLATVPYPFDHGSDVGGVSDVVVQKIPEPSQLGDVLGAALAVSGRFDTMVFRMLASLTQWAEKVETVLGFERLPDPPQRDEQEQEAALMLQRRRSRRYWLEYSGRAVAGIVMLAALIGLSVFPPTLPSFGDSSVQYRPAAFRPSMSQPISRPQIRPPGRSWMPMPMGGMNSNASQWNSRRGGPPAPPAPWRPRQPQPPPSYWQRPPTPYPPAYRGYGGGRSPGGFAHH